MEKVFLIIIITLIVGIGIVYLIITNNPNKIEKLRIEEEKQNQLDNIQNYKFCIKDSQCMELTVDPCSCPIAVNDSNFVKRINAYNNQIGQLDDTPITCTTNCSATNIRCVQNQCIAK